MIQINSAPDKTSVLKWWSRLENLPAGNRIFSLALGWMTPYSGSIRSRVEELKPGYARVSMRDRRRVRNHLHSIHAIALINLGEIATGLAVLSSITENMRGIVVDIHAEYLKKARGQLVASAEFELPETLQNDTPCEVEALLRNQAGETVTRVTATWLIGYRT
jgi:acyl-coenzyme A thioesterase PaaI-like protein